MNVLCSVLLMIQVAHSPGGQVPPAPPQANQAAIAKTLLSADPKERAEAASAVAGLTGHQVGEELRTALFVALEREAQLHADRYYAGRRGETLPTLSNPEFISTLSRIVAEFRTPDAIPALTAALFTGAFVPRVVADFGELAAPAVLRVVADPRTRPTQVDGGLIALRFMVEGAAEQPLSAQTLEDIRRVARQRLTGTQYFTTLWQAIDLAMVLEDSELTGIVTELAFIPDAVEQRGIQNPDIIERTQQRARERLAGVPAKPTR